LRDKIIYTLIIFFSKLTGRWKYPVKSSGDLETMTRRDKIYWLYKTVNPVKRAYKGSGIESFLNSDKNIVGALPEGFVSEKKISIAAAGDLMPHQYLQNSADTLYNEVYASIFEKDIAMANLECCIVSGRKEKLVFDNKKGPVLYYTEGDFDIVKGFGVHQYDFMATACNHSLDLGVEGAESTIRHLKNREIAFNGLNNTEEESNRATILEKNDIQVGVLSCSFGLNAYKAPVDRPYFVNHINLNDETARIDLTQIKKQVSFCHENNVDFIIAQLHWGYEHEFYPRPEQIATAHYFAECGIDCIIGHHPHVVQPVEYYRTSRDIDRLVPIYYSLGNLINPFSAPYLTLSYLAQLILAKGIHKGKSRTYVKEAGFSKVLQQVNGKNKTISLKHMV